MTHASLMYRHLSGKPLRDRVEVLHSAEAYQLTGKTLTAVQYCPFQGLKEVNDSQRLCSYFSLIWRKPDGSLIPLTQRYQYMPELAGQPPQLNPNWYTGPTQCPHRAAGCPCYGPFPDVIELPSMLTPKRAGNAKERGGKKGHDKDEPVGKKAREDPTQKKLNFAASSSLQLTN
jgi:hypothetical protein